MARKSDRTRKIHAMLGKLAERLGELKRPQSDVEAMLKGFLEFSNENTNPTLQVAWLNARFAELRDEPRVSDLDRKFSLGIVPTTGYRDGSR